jgi:hypothetical protein
MATPSPSPLSPTVLYKNIVSPHGLENPNALRFRPVICVILADEESGSHYLVVDTVIRRREIAALHLIELMTCSALVDLSFNHVPSSIE